MPQSQEYRDDLAYIHDRGYGALANDAATRLVAELADARIASGTVVDLGCGSGVLAQALGKAGYHVVGVDQSEAMLGPGTGGRTCYIELATALGEFSKARIAEVYDLFDRLMRDSKPAAAKAAK